jgi:hypothetical protein
MATTTRGGGPGFRRGKRISGASGAEERDGRRSAMRSDFHVAEAVRVKREIPPGITKAGFSAPPDSTGRVEWF